MKTIYQVHQGWFCRVIVAAGSTKRNAKLTYIPLWRVSEEEAVDHAILGNRMAS